jgi:FkbM family methyltransferase
MLIEMIDTVLSTPEIKSDPPVLVDIGASGELYPKWEAVAPHSVCIAFDPDAREMNEVRAATQRYSELHIYDCIVTNRPERFLDFFLTKSPYCSSTLEPSSDSLESWLFSDLFSLQRKVELEATSLPSVIAELGIQHVDWIKIDSQGTDLRLFESLPRNLADKILVAEFEPGIIDSYRGEDKLHRVMSALEDRPFWMSDLRIHGSKRLNIKRVTPALPRRDFERFTRGLPVSPGWGEVTYMNTMEGNRTWTKRDYFLAWVFACVQDQFGFALELALDGNRRFVDPLFADMEVYTLERAKMAARRAALKSVSRSIYSRAVAGLRALGR